MQVMTWNMQAGQDYLESKWYTDVARLFTQLEGEVDVLLLQEAGTPPPDASVATPPQWLTGLAPTPGLPWGFFSWSVGTLFARRTLNILWIMLDFVDTTNNLALVWDPTTVSVSNLIFAANPAGGRPAPGIVVRSSSGSLCNVFTVNTFAPNGDDAASLTNAIAQASQSASSQSASNWFVAGEFHRAPNSFTLPKGASFCEHNQSNGSDTELVNMYAINSGSPINGTVFTEFVRPDQFSVLYPSGS